jgi:hypothetical protein
MLLIDLGRLIMMGYSSVFHSGRLNGLTNIGSLKYEIN